MVDINKNPEEMTPEEIYELQRQNCLFCQIIDKKIPSNIVYEDEKVMCILDIRPSNIGHTIIIPKEHVQIIPQVNDETIKHMFKVAKHISHSILKSFVNEGINGTNLFLANGAVAGQKAPHLILHIIPRTNEDKFLKFEKKSLEEQKIIELKNKISEKLNPKNSGSTNSNINNNINNSNNHNINNNNNNQTQKKQTEQTNKENEKIDLDEINLDDLL